MDSPLYQDLPDLSNGVLAACIGISKKREEGEKATKNPGQIKPRQPEPTPPPASAPDAPPSLAAFRSFELDAAGKPLACRIVLPPNLAASAPRNMIVLKLELLCEGRRAAPERLFKGCAYRVDAKTLKALLMVENWTHDKLAGLLQVKRAQLADLIEVLGGEPCFEWAGKPDRPLEWADGSLKGVGEHLADPTPAPLKDDAGPAQGGINVRRSSGVTPPPPQSVLDMHPMPPPRSAVRQRESEEESRMQVDGSPHFLAMRIPGGDFPLRERAATLFEQNGFRLEPSNARWWLRDRHKVLNFLAEHGDEFERVYAPLYSANYKERMVAVRRARITARATQETSGDFALNMRISAGNLDENDIRRALASRQYYIISGDSIWLLPPAMLDRMAKAQCALSGHPGQAFVPSISRRLSTAQLCDADALLEGLECEIETPGQWKSRSRALKEFSALQRPPIPDALDEMLRGYQRVGAAWLWHL
ncbi:MAG: hypothetical protein WC360_09675, partial [Opitutales bacterium]